MNSVDKPRLRAPAFSEKEDEALIKTYSKYRNVIRGRNSMGVSQKTRNEAWDAVAKAVNAVDGRYERTVKSVKIHYGNMLAEYKAYKASDKHAQAQPSPQSFYQFFDELFMLPDCKAIPIGDAGGNMDTLNGDEPFENINSENLDGQQNYLFSSLYQNNLTNLSSDAVVDCKQQNLTALMNNAFNVHVNSLTTNGDEQFANFAAAIQQQQQLGLLRKTETFSGSSESSGSGSGRNSVSTPPIGGSAINNIANHLARGLNNGGDCTPNFHGVVVAGATNHNESAPVAVSGWRPAKRRRVSGTSSVAMTSTVIAGEAPARNVDTFTPNDTKHNTNSNFDSKASSNALHHAVAYRRLRTLRTKILEKQLSILSWKEKTLKKKDRLLELKILNEERLLKKSDSMNAPTRKHSSETIGAFEPPGPLTIASQSDTAMNNNDEINYTT